MSKRNLTMEEALRAALHGVETDALVTNEHADSLIAEMLPYLTQWVAQVRAEEREKAAQIAGEFSGLTSQKIAARIREQESAPRGDCCDCCDDGSVPCGAVMGMYRCTRAIGHEGVHVACGVENHDLTGALHAPHTPSDFGESETVADAPKPSNVSESSQTDTSAPRVSADREKLIEEALERDRRDWYVDHEAEPGIAGNAFERGWDAALAAPATLDPVKVAEEISRWMHAYGQERITVKTISRALCEAYEKGELT